MNPVNTTEKLIQAIQDIISTYGLKGTTLTNLKESVSSLEVILEVLRDIHENQFSLESNVNQVSSHKANLRFWLEEYSMESRIDTKQLIRNSITLETLYKKGINIEDVYKFSDKEDELADKLGRVFFCDPRIIDSLKKALNYGKKSRYVLAKGSCFGVTMDLIKSLQSANILRRDIQFSVRVKGKDEIIKPSKARILAKRDQGRFIQISFDFDEEKKFKTLLEGHWFNSYAYKIILDHLTRNQYDFEIYTRVKYSAPVDILAAKSDFDILAMVENSILLVECKSGNIDERHERNIRDIIEKANALKSVFNVTQRKFNYISVLVYNGSLVDHKFLNEQFKNSGFILVELGKLRESIIKIFRNEYKVQSDSKVYKEDRKSKIALNSVSTSDKKKEQSHTQKKDQSPVESKKGFLSKLFGG